MHRTSLNNRAPGRESGREREGFASVCAVKPAQEALALHHAIAAAELRLSRRRSPPAPSAPVRHEAEMGTLDKLAERT